METIVYLHTMAKRKTASLLVFFVCKEVVALKINLTGSTVAGTDIKEHCNRIAKPNKDALTTLLNLALFGFFHRFNLY